jgi:predicted dehydrogenase
VLATGKIASALVPDLLSLDECEVVAVASRRQESADAFAAEHGIATAYGDYRSLVEDPDVDVVYVATPHALHREHVELAFEAGKAVLCEKPLTLTAGDAEALVAMARERDLFLMEAMWMRCNPGIRRVTELIADGAIGEVTAVHADFGLPGPFPPEHRLRNPALGGGALLDLGVYPVSLAHLLLGAPSEVRSWARLSPEGVDENTGILFGYDSGAVAALTCGLIGGTRNAATITGRTGRIELPSGFHRPQTVTVHRGGTDPEILEFPAEGWGYHYEAAEVHRCLAAGELESPLVPHSTTLEVMGLLDTIRGQIGVTYAGQENSGQENSDQENSGRTAK